MTTQMIHIGKPAQKIQVTVPEQSDKPVRYAHETAKALNKESRLATFAETVNDKQILAKANRKYLLAVDSKDLPANAGWYLVQRQTDNISVEPTSGKQAQVLINEGRWDEALYVNQSAVNAAKESRPLVLLAGGGMGYLDAFGWPDLDARVVLVKLEPKPEVQAGHGATEESKMRPSVSLTANGFSKEAFIDLLRKAKVETTHTKGAAILLLDALEIKE